MFSPVPTSPMSAKPLCRFQGHRSSKEKYHNRLRNTPLLFSSKTKALPPDAITFSSAILHAINFTSRSLIWYSLRSFRLNFSRYFLALSVCGSIGFKSVAIPWRLKNAACISTKSGRSIVATGSLDVDCNSCLSNSIRAGNSSSSFPVPSNVPIVSRICKRVAPMHFVDSAGSINWYSKPVPLSFCPFSNSAFNSFTRL